MPSSVLAERMNTARADAIPAKDGPPVDFR